jgi:hypothetical protein
VSSVHYVEVTLVIDGRLVTDMLAAGHEQQLSRMLGRMALRRLQRMVDADDALARLVGTEEAAP